MVFRSLKKKKKRPANVEFVVKEVQGKKSKLGAGQTNLKLSVRDWSHAGRCGSSVESRSARDMSQTGFNGV